MIQVLHLSKESNSVDHYSKVRNTLVMTKMLLNPSEGIIQTLQKSQKLTITSVNIRYLCFYLEYRSK